MRALWVLERFVKPRVSEKGLVRALRGVRTTRESLGSQKRVS